MTALNETPLPCPFCGTEPRFCAVSDVTDKFDHGYTISCDTCGIEMADEYKSGVAEAWNKRALHASEPDAVAAERAEPVAWIYQDPRDKSHRFATLISPAEKCFPDDRIVTPLFDRPSDPSIAGKEREACAKLAELYGKGKQGFATSIAIAAAIRSRSQP